LPEAPLADPVAPDIPLEPPVSAEPPSGLVAEAVVSGGVAAEPPAVELSAAVSDAAELVFFPPWHAASASVEARIVVAIRIRTGLVPSGSELG
jgi:hypothetical protein